MAEDGQSNVTRNGGGGGGAERCVDCLCEVLDSSTYRHFKHTDDAAICAMRYTLYENVDRSEANT
jgi:hypothetical protein